MKHVKNFSSSNVHFDSENFRGFELIFEGVTADKKVPPGKFCRLSEDFTKHGKRQQEVKRDGRLDLNCTWTDRLDGLLRLRRTDGVGQRDRDEKQISSRTDGQSVKQTGV